MLEEIIRRVPFFATLPPRHIRWLSETLQPQDVLRGAVLFDEGEPGDFFYIIVQGELEVLESRTDRGRPASTVCGPGECVGELSLLHPQGLRTATVRALTDAEVLLMTRGDFDALLKRQPTLGYQLARVLGQRLEKAYARSIRDLEERNRVLQTALDELQAAQVNSLSMGKPEE